MNEILNKCQSRHLYLFLEALYKDPKLIKRYRVSEYTFTGQEYLIIKAMKQLIEEGYKVFNEAVLTHTYEMLHCIEKEIDVSRVQWSPSHVADIASGYPKFNAKNFRAYYIDVKKYNLLRKAMAAGKDVSHFYEPEDAWHSPRTSTARKLLLRNISLSRLRRELRRAADKIEEEVCDESDD